MIKLLNILNEIKVRPNTPTKLVIYHYDPSSYKLNNKEEIEYSSKQEAEEAAIRDYWRIAWDNMHTDLSEDEFVKQTTFEDILNSPYDTHDYELKSLNEIKVEPDIPSEEVNEIIANIIDYFNDSLGEYVVDIINNHKEYFLEFILKQTISVNIYAVVARFIKLHMIANQYELEKNGQEMLVSLSNAKLINKNDIINYINENADIKRYLEKITWKYYIDYVNKHKNKILDRILEYVKSNSNEEEYFLYRIRGNIDNHHSINQYTIDLILDIMDEAIGYPEDIFNDIDFEEYLRRTLEQSEMLGENRMIKLLPLLKEYSEKTVNDTIARWGIDPEDKRAVDDAKAVIQRFEQIKGSLNQRLDIAVIPDEIRNKDYKNIDLYSYEDIIALLRSLPESEEKIKKEAIRRFVEESGFDRNTVQSIVARFMTKKAAIKLAVKDGLEDIGYSAEEVQEFIPKRLFKDDKYLDPRYWKWSEFERMMDTLFPAQGKIVGSEKKEENTAETDADKIYDKDGLEIYLADDYHKCVKYNPVLSSGMQKYSWCVTKPGSGQGFYQGYRFGQQSPTFYFVFDRNLPSSPDYARFDNKWHAFVIQVNADGDTYVITSANNGDDTSVGSWEEIGSKPVGGESIDPEVWSKLKGLKSYFKPVSLSPVERAQKLTRGMNLTVDEFKELSQDEKINYIIGKASENKLKSDILSILPKYKIPYQGRTVTLANIAIDAGQRFTYNDLKEYESLAKRYAIFRFKHTDYGKEPIPLPFVQYLDDKSKYEYYKTFDDNLTFNLIDKYFGKDIAKEYVNEQANKLSYLPAAAYKYMSPNQKEIYNLLYRLYGSWVEKVSDEDTIESSNIMPTQIVTPTYPSVEDWQNLSSSDKSAIFNLAKRYDGDEEYTILLYALPYMVEQDGKVYVLLPTNKTFREWVLLNKEGNIIEDNINGRISYVGDRRLLNGYFAENKPYRVYDADEVKINDEPFSSIIKENITIAKRFQKLAGIKEIRVVKPGFDTWLDELYTVILNNTNLEEDEISIDEDEAKSYFNNGKTPEEVYFDVWVQDYGNFYHLAENR